MTQIKKPLKEHNYGQTQGLPLHKFKNIIADHNGITLIALIITIIVMAILLGATMSIALNGGLFSRAKQAVDDTVASRDEESKLASGKIKVGDEWYDSLDEYIENHPSEDQNREPIELPEGIKVGDYVNYTPDTKTYKVIV